MNLKESILKEHSVTQRDTVVQWVGSSQQRFDELINLMLGKEPVLAQRAAWAVSYCVEAHPLLIQKHLQRLVKSLQQEALHDAVRRNTVRILEQVPVPEKLHGILMDACFGLVASPSTSIAVKAFSLGILSNLAKTYPEIIDEIKLLVNDQGSNASPGIKSKCKHVLQQLSRL